MRGLALILLLSSFSAFAQDCDKIGSIVTFSEDVKQADQKLMLKELRGWYKEKVSKKEAESTLMESRTVADYPLNCEMKDNETVCKGSQYILRPVLPLKEGDKKSKNPYLAQVFSKKDSKIEKVELEGSGMGGFVYVVHKLKKDGSKIQYKINTNLSAANNPIAVIDESKGKVEYAQLYSLGASFSSNGYVGW